MADNGQNNEVNEQLKQTEIGSFFLRHKTPLIALIALVIIGVLGNGVYGHFRGKKEIKLANALYQFKQDDFSKIEVGSMTEDDFITKYSALAKEQGCFTGFFSESIFMVDKLIEKSHHKAALHVMNTLQGQFKGESTYMDYVLFQRLAVTNENSGKLEDAVAALERITALSVKLVEAKVYFDLGRLYMKLENKEKAKKNFQYMIDNFASEKLTNVAKVLIEKL